MNVVCHGCGGQMECVEYCRACSSPEVAHSGPTAGVALPDAPDTTTLALDVLEHIRDWATLDPEGQRFPWIAARTAEALDALREARS